MGRIILVSIVLTIIVGTFLTKGGEEVNLFAMKEVKAETATSSSGSGWQLFNGPAIAVTEEPKAETETAPAPTEEIGVDDDTIGNEGEVDEIDTNATWEVHGEAPTPLASDSADRFGRCIEVAGIYQSLKQQYNFTTPEAEVCALGDQENGGKPMPLGATRGQPSETSSAGARGTFQVVPGTAALAWKALGRTDAYNPEQLEHNMAVAIHYLEAMRRKHGDNRFRAYNAGGAVIKGVNYYERNPDVAGKTARYQKGINDNIQLFQAVLANKTDLRGSVGGMVVVNFSPPIPYGGGWISAVFGEPRAYRKGVHQGMDFAAVVGTNVIAIVDGTVAFAGQSNTEGGKRAGIQIQLIHGNGAIGTLGGSRYFHLDSIVAGLKKGDKVKAGQVIGTVGSTGVKKSGAHLHFESYIWSANNKLLVCTAPGNWFPTGPFSPNFASYTGPQTPGSKWAANKFNRMNAGR